MATNVFYLKETSLDALLGETDAPQFNAASTKLFAGTRAHTGQACIYPHGSVLHRDY